jgi:hypothetical protein
VKEHLLINLLWVEKRPNAKCRKFLLGLSKRNIKKFLKTFYRGTKKQEKRFTTNVEQC